jgi:hypothetical protein
MYARLWWGNLKERDHFENLGVDGSIFKFILKKQIGMVLTDTWRAFISRVIKLSGTYNAGNSLTR